ncbi:MAG: DUF1080 domain-containing protein [Bacteroidota bacterium]
MRIISILSIVLVVNACGLGGAFEEKVVEGRQVIFNGKDTRGWEEVGELAVEIENDAMFLTNQSDELAFLYSDKSYENFILYAEFLAPFINSGIAIRLENQDADDLAASSYLVNIDWEEEQQHPLGSIVGVARAKVSDSLKAGEWHRIQIEAIGDHLRVLVNDELLSESHDRKWQKGKIALLAPTESGQTIGFRELLLEEVDAPNLPDVMMEHAYRRNQEVPLESMFPDDSFEGWDPIGDGSWRISKGVVHGYSGREGGYLVSEEAYKNFYLKFSFKIKKEDNSGVFIRKSPDREDVSLEDALECNIYDHNGFSHPYSTGSIVTHARAWYGMIDYEAWNQMEIFAKEDHIVMYVNGEKSSDTHVPDMFNKAGNICLQAGIQVFSENKGPSDIYFKDVMIKNMDGE